MKSLIATLVLFSLTLGGIILNAVYVNAVADDLEQQIAALPDACAADCVAAVSSLRADWERRAAGIEFASGFATTDRIGEYLSSLLACAECGDLFGYHSARALLLNAISDMRRPERLSFGAIF